MTDLLVEILGYLVCIWVGVGGGFLLAAFFMNSHN